MGFLGFVSQIACTIGMQREKSASAGIARQALAPVLGFLWQVLLVPNDPIFWTAPAGGAILIACLILTILAKLQRKEVPVETAQEANGCKSALGQHATIYGKVDVMGTE